jgi:hypothetical protein
MDGDWARWVGIDAELVVANFNLLFQHLREGNDGNIGYSSWSEK